MEKPEFVKDIDNLRDSALTGGYARLLTVFDEHGFPNRIDRAALLRRVRHRDRVGVACGVRPAGTLPSPEWADAIRGLGLDVVSYAVAHPAMDQAREVNGLEVYMRTLRFLQRDRKIDGVLIVTPTVPLAPLARHVHDKGLPLIVAAARAHVARWSLLADATFAIDDFLVGELAK